MGQIWLLGKITFKEGVRNRILFGILFIAIIFFAFNIVFTQMFSFDLNKVSVDLGLSMISLSGLAVIFFMGINLLARDFEKRTIYMVISRPIARWQYVTGKFLGLTMMVGVSVAILGVFSAASIKAAMIISPDYISKNYSWSIFLISVCFSFLSLMVMTALAQLFTSLTTSSFIALLLTASTYFIGQNVEIVRKTCLDTNGMELGQVYRGLIKMVSWLFPNLQAFDLKTIAGYGLPLNSQHLVWTAFYGISYILIILGLTIIVFQRRELS